MKTTETEENYPNSDNRFLHSKEMINLATRKLIHSETWRRSGVKTFYQHSLLCRVVANPGVSTQTLAELLGTQRNAISSLVKRFRGLGLLRSEFITGEDGLGRKQKIYPTPFLKDLVNAVEEVQP